MNTNEIDILYHYCDNKKMANIFSEKQLRMSDIMKSNDYEEVRLFFPYIFKAIEDEYIKNSFDFRYGALNGLEAIRALLENTSRLVNGSFNDGSLSSFVVCFCEDGDSLGQWRGYADDGKGCSIGLSYSELLDYCKKSDGIIRIEKVEYKTWEEIDEIICNEAKKILNRISNPSFMRLFSKSSSVELLDTAMVVELYSVFNDVAIASLKYKHISFKEEKEWRMFFTDITKNTKTLYEKTDIKSVEYNKMVDFLKDKIEFKIKDDDIVCFYPINIMELSNNPIKHVICGPKNKISKSDFKLFSKLKGFEEIELSYSESTYR